MRKSIPFFNNFCYAAKAAGDEQHRDARGFEGGNKFFGAWIGLDVTIDQTINNRSVGAGHQLDAGS